MSAGPVTLDRVGIAIPATRPQAAPSPACAPVAPGDATTDQPFTSGFCGAGLICRDYRGKCKGTFENEHLADIPTLHCTCVCHPEAKVATTI